MQIEELLKHTKLLIQELLHISSQVYILHIVLLFLIHKELHLEPSYASALCCCIICELLESGALLVQILSSIMVNLLQLHGATYIKRSPDTRLYF